MSSSRGFLREPIPGRTSTKFYPQGPHSGRMMNEPRTNYNSRQFQAGIFTNQLNRKAEMGRKKDQGLPLEFTQVDRFGSKIRSSKKQYQDENVKEDMLREEMQEMCDKMQMRIMDKVKKLVFQYNGQTQEQLDNIVKQTNNGFMKTDGHIKAITSQNRNLSEQLNKFYAGYRHFIQENEEKMENMYTEMASLGMRKSRTNGQYNMDIKNSFQGLNSSMSVNLGNQSQNPKLVNEVIFQLDSQRKELTETKQLIDELTAKLNSKLVQAKSQSRPKEEIKLQAPSFNKEEVSAMIKQAFMADRKKFKYDEKIETIENKLKDVDLIIMNQEENIKGMNEEFANVVNVQINPKIKKIESALVDIYGKIDLKNFQTVIKASVDSKIDQTLKNTKLLKLRQPSKSQSSKLSILTGANQSKISYKQTYFLDQQNYLLDSEVKQHKTKDKNRQ